MTEPLGGDTSTQAEVGTVLPLEPGERETTVTGEDSVGSFSPLGSDVEGE